MSQPIYSAIAKADSGFVEAPAGCGKTEAIVRTVADHCAEPQLVLTHTHAGVDALRQRFRGRGVPSTSYHVDTIAGWSWGWVRRYRDNAAYSDSSDIPTWPEVYAGMRTLLTRSFVRSGIRNSYAGAIVDEYQDCTTSMHDLIVGLNNVLPCRVLGDPLQGIFDFNESLVKWTEVETSFRTDLGTLNTPHRWIKAGNRPLGRFLLGGRADFASGREASYVGTPIGVRRVPIGRLGPELVRVTAQKGGRLCVIGPKNRPLRPSVETALVRRGFRILEANDLPSLRPLVDALAAGAVGGVCTRAAQFLKRAYGGVSANEVAFVTKVLREGTTPSRRPDRQTLCQKCVSLPTNERLLAVVEYCSNLAGACQKHTESIEALRGILETTSETDTDVRSLYADEIRRRKFRSRAKVERCIGSTLLVKGLEFDHSVIVRPERWDTNWGSYRDLYVALTRGSKSTTIIETRE